MSNLPSKLSSALGKITDDFSIQYLSDENNANFNVPALRLYLDESIIDITASYIVNSDTDRLVTDFKVALHTKQSPNDHIKFVK